MFPPLLSIAPRLAGVHRAAAQNFLTARGGLLICVLFALTGVALAGDYGIGLDVANQREIAVANLDYILGRADRIATTTYHDRVYGVAFELPLLLAERALGLTDSYSAGRLRSTLTHLFFILGAFFCYRLAWRLFDNRLIAILALLLFLLHPRLYAHSYLNSKDLPFLALLVIALYLLERAFRRDTFGAFLLLGIAVGLLTNLRIMGIMLFPAVIAMRALDLFYAGGGPERKQILLTAGLFLLAAGLTWYAVTPYAWTNPVDYLAANLDLTINLPTDTSVLFQGQRIFSDQLPPHYAATWFGITTPPLILLLGFIGMACVVARVFRRPGAVFRNTRLRLALLLLACFLLPPLAAALLGSNQYGDWRHSYFIYAPFCLLAAGGLGWLAADWFRRRPGPAATYGLTGLGLALIALQLAQLHPVQYNYFNFLVDRTTPEYLRTQYQLDYWPLAAKAALEHLLASHPGEALVVRAERRHRSILPAAVRQRLQPAAGQNADYDLTYSLDPSQPDLAFNSEYRRQIYNNTLVTARPLHAARMTPAAIAAYREIYRQALAGEPVIRADYDVYFQNHRLTFVKENCRPGEPDVRFGANAYPPSLPNNSPGNRAPSSFSNRRVRLGELCLAVLQLPDYIRGDLILSQSHPGWAELYSLSPPGLREQIAELRSQQPPPDPGAFAVFLEPDAAGGYRLLYAKGDCSQAEYETQVFLHILPENPADLPFYLWKNGVDNRGFPLNRYGGRPGGECLAIYPLPDYPIASLLTGQAGVWEVNLYPPADPDTLRADYAALSALQPAARAAFDLYIQDNRLLYLRETCAAADPAAGFFLHIIPIDTAALPAERQAAGFANLDFAFARWGGSFDGKCLAAVPLPEYPLKEIRTGQHIPGQGNLWSVELIAAPDYDQLRADYAALSVAEPAARNYFALYWRDNRLFYLRENCAADDTAAAFFLHIVPVDAADLPAERRPAGFAHGGFNFTRQGGHFDGKCLAVVTLPDYPGGIKEMRTGQYVPGQGDLWSARLTVER